MGNGKTPGVPGEMEYFVDYIKMFNEFEGLKENVNQLVMSMNLDVTNNSFISAMGHLLRIYEENRGWVASMERRSSLNPADNNISIPVTDDELNRMFSEILSRRPAEYDAEYDCFGQTFSP